MSRGPTDADRALKRLGWKPQAGEWVWVSSGWQKLWSIELVVGTTEGNIVQLQNSGGTTDLKLRSLSEVFPHGEAPS